MTDTDKKIKGAKVERFDPFYKRQQERKMEGGQALSIPNDADLVLADFFAEQHATDLRYVAGWGKWLRWDGTRWAFDETLQVQNFAREMCLALAGRFQDEKIAREVASRRKAAALEAVARCDPRLSTDMDKWDTDPWLLNTPNGVIDLRTGDLWPHRREDYITKITAVGPDGDCPLWMEFLDRITGSDVSLQGFLQRLFGYALTGSTREHTLSFLHGGGANGKSVLINTAQCIFHDYARAAPMETLTVSHGDRHPTELAALRGARLVAATETEEGRRWDESKIKQLTGGDKIAARLMRRDFFEYTPTFKLLVAGNHKPALRSVGEAIRRRLHLIPFDVTIPNEERDPNLAERLRAEWPGILAWGVEGCLMWQKMGLAPPERVLAATNDYIAAEDTLSQWLDECCDQAPGLFCQTSRLYSSWKAWAERSGEYVGSMKRFSQVMADHGFVRCRTKAAKGFRDIALKANET